MWLDEKDFKKYIDSQLCICYKAFTSTSKSRQYAETFLKISPTNVNKLRAVCTYVIESNSGIGALDVQKYSKYPDEMEVLIFPGALFKVGKAVRTSSSSVEIELLTAMSTTENLMSLSDYNNMN